MLARTLFLSPKPTRNFTSLLRKMSTSQPIIKFGPYEVTEQVFYKTPLSYALVNHKPIVPGHVLIIPFRQVPRLTDLTQAEVTDLFTTTQKVQKMLASVYFPSASTTSSPDNLSNGSFNVALQDGIDAGQSVPHVHVHIVPRLRDNELGDGVYALLAGEEGNVGGHLWDVRERPKVQKPLAPIVEEDRKVRSFEVMNEEARSFEEKMQKLDEESDSAR